VLFLLGLLDALLDPADLGLRAGLRNDGDAAAVGDDRPSEEHARLVLDARVGRHGISRLGHRRRLARERALVGRERRRLEGDEARVGGDAVAHAHLDDVAGHQLRRRQLVEPHATAQALAVVWLELLQRVQCRRRRRLLPHTDYGVDGKDEHDHGRLDPAVLLVLDPREHVRQRRHTQQNLYEPVVELRRKQPPQWRRCLNRQHVGTVDLP
jgi:hypothetical protein